MIVLLEYIDILQFYKQSTANIWVDLSLASPTLGSATILNDADTSLLLLLKFPMKEFSEQIQMVGISDYCKISFLCVKLFVLWSKGVSTIQE